MLTFGAPGSILADGEHRSFPMKLGNFIYSTEINNLGNCPIKTNLHEGHFSDRSVDGDQYQ